MCVVEQMVAQAQQRKVDNRKHRFQPSDEADARSCSLVSVSRCRPEILRRLGLVIVDVVVASSAFASVNRHQACMARCYL